MKKTIATICLVGSTLAVSACTTTEQGYIDTAPPYEQDRTAQYESEVTPVATPTAVVPAERVFQRAQTK